MHQKHVDLDSSEHAQTDEQQTNVKSIEDDLDCAEDLTKDEQGLDNNVFNVNNGDVIVNELLCYVISKISVVPRDELCKIIVDFYANGPGDPLAQAASTLHKKVNQLGRLKGRIGGNRSLSYAKDIYDDLQNCMNNR